MARLHKPAIWETVVSDKTAFNVKYVIIAPILYHFVFNLSTTIEKLVKIVPFFTQERAFFDEKCPKKAILYVIVCHFLYKKISHPYDGIFVFLLIFLLLFENNALEIFLSSAHEHALTELIRIEGVVDAGDLLVIRRNAALIDRASCLTA